MTAELSPEVERDLVARVLGVAPDRVGWPDARQVLQRPSGRRLVTYRAQVDGAAREAVLVVGAGGPRRGTVRLDLPDGTPVAGFRPADDPRLPGLAVALDPARLGDLLGRGVVGVRRRRYRPLARAVVEAQLADGGRVWVKVLRPARLAEVAQVHQRVAAVAAGPAVLATDEERGLLVLDDLAGTPLRELVRGDAHLLPPPVALLRLSDDLAGAVVERRAPRTAPLEAIDAHVRRLRRIVPDRAVDVAALGAAILRAGAAAPAQPTVTVHGDLHAAQVLAADGAITGVLDLDDVGRGTQADDLGRFVGHLACTVAVPRGEPGRAWAGAVEAAVLARVPAPVLAPRVAAVVLGLATGPHRVHRAGWRQRTLDRLDLARRWLAAA